METQKYLYIDDENGQSEEATLHGFNDIGLLEVERFPLGDFKEFGKLKIELIERLNNSAFDGLIIDLRLDGTGEDRTEFNATSLSQELRSISASGEIRTFPIVLCSTEQKIKQTYDSDRTSHDLFDYKISKSNPTPNWQKLAYKLFSLANGYSWLNSTEPSPKEILGLDNLTDIDERILEKFNFFSVGYDYAHFVIKNLFHQTNPLINEKILAARLGIDIYETPKEAWELIANDLFAEAKYYGLFWDGWKRWWAEKVNKIFLKLSGERLAFIDAVKRVEILAKATGINSIVSAQPLRFCRSSEFWTICEGYKRPIDPLEAFKIYTTVDLKPWQESKYISLLAILEREGFADRGLRPHTSELEKIEYTKQLLEIE